MRVYVWVFVAAVALALVVAPGVQADSLKIQPLQYQAELKKGEYKKGFVDITNPTASSAIVELYVNGFSQVDDKGNLVFFEDEQIKRGIRLDYDTATIGPKQTLRLFFVIDGNKLPTGDIFAAIFAQTKAANQPGANTSVRVGSLIMVTNQTPGSRKATIAQLDMATVQIGDGVQGSVAVKNSAQKGSTTGFFPSIGVEVAPWGGESIFKGPLIFAGNTRTSDFYVPTNLFGVYQVTVSANDARKTTTVFLVTGWWRIVAPAATIALIGAVFVAVKYKILHKKPRFRRR